MPVIFLGINFVGLNELSAREIQKIKKENVLGESSVYCIVCTVMVYQLVMQERTNVLVVQLFKDWKIEKKKRLGCQFILLVFTIYNGLPVTMTLN